MIDDCPALLDSSFISTPPLFLPWVSDEIDSLDLTTPPTTLMMMSRVESRKISGDGSGSGRLLRDIEEISKALYLHNAPPKALNSSTDQRSKSAGKTRPSESHIKYVDEDLLQNDKKSSIWNWKPLKALTHIRNHRLSCCFLLRVHSIEGLPMNFTGLNLSVHWKRKEAVLSTSPIRVIEGVAEFEETLMHRCSVYFSKSGSQHSSSVKYDPKLFLLYVSMVGAPGIDIGKHWIDLTRLLPLTLEEKTSSGKWMTSFKLSGKAKGATMNVSFGFSLSEDNLLEFEKVADLLKGSGATGNPMLRGLGSVPSNSNHMTHISSTSLDIKLFNEVLPYKGSEITQSITFLYRKLDEEIPHDQNELASENMGTIKSKLDSLPATVNTGYGSSDEEFNVVDQGVEFPVKELKINEDDAQSINDSALEAINVANIFEDGEASPAEEIDCKSNNKGHGELKDPTSEELESFLRDLSIFESSEFDEREFNEEERNMKANSIYQEGKMVQSLSFDSVADSVENEFLSLLGNDPYPGPDSEPESPRERLLRQFEEEALASGDPIFAQSFNDAMTKQKDCSETSDDFALSVLLQGSVMEHHKVIPSLTSRRKAEMLENLETEALMQEWGLNERAFIYSPRTSSGAFGSPVYLSPEEPPELPSLGEGLGPIFQTKGEGFLRSMIPSIFRNAKNGENLIMQVSSSVVLPASMGSNARELLERWASVGAEKMSLQVNELMPLEDINGKTLQHVAWEAQSKFEGHERERLLLHDPQAGIGRIKVEGTRICSQVGSEYVALEDIVPSAMDKIQHLSIEGLRIQCGMSADEAPESIHVRSIEEISVSSSQSADIIIDINELISLSVSLNEWIQLDSGIIDDDYDDNGSRLSKILAVHCSSGTDVIRHDKWGELSSKTCGCLGNNLTICVQVLLRDPFRDFEAVGTPILALIQIERDFVKMGMDIQEKEHITKHEGDLTQFRITEIHVAGLKSEPGNKLLHSGSRWLHSSGMGKTNKRSFLNSNSMVKSSSKLVSKLKHEDTLWSISSYVQSAGVKWKELSSFNLHVRNPDIVF